MRLRALKAFLKTNSIRCALEMPASWSKKSRT